MPKTLALAVIVFTASILPAQSSPAQSIPSELSGDQAILHALNRLTFGPRPGDVEAVEKMGLSEWIDLQLHPERIPENEALTNLVATLMEPATGQEMLRSAMAGMRDSRVQGGPLLSGQVLRLLQPGETLAQGKLYRAIRSDRQLEEVLVDFWYNHFNVDASKGSVRFAVTGYERDAIRPHVFGSFRELLGATAHSAAMMVYLDNAQSTARGLNENYARELMELHTLGVDGGYTQKDIVEVARCFTGWTVDNPGVLANASFIYNAQIHDKGEKTVFGVSIPAGGGKEDGEKVLDILARHPSTARFISKKLAQRFVADDPPPALIDRMAGTFLFSHGDIRAVLTTLFSSTEFFSEGAYRSKVKTPLEMVVSAVRATGAQVDNPAPLVTEIATQGQPLYRKGEPTGYSNRGAAWASSAALLERMNFALQLGQNQVGGTKVAPEKFSADPGTAARQVLFTSAEQQTIEAIENAIRDGSYTDTALVVGMLIGSPDFQRR